MANHGGGCLCGAVRYELTAEPFDCGWCHCRTCQLYSGAPAMAFACVGVDDFVWTRGEPRWLESSSFGRRAFCGTCGSPLMVKVDHQPETVDFPAVTLDDPAIAAPEFHIFWRSRSAGSIQATTCPGTTGSGPAPGAWMAPSRRTTLP